MCLQSIQFKVGSGIIAILPFLHALVSAFLLHVGIHCVGLGLCASFDRASNKLRIDITANLKLCRLLLSDIDFAA